MKTEHTLSPLTPEQIAQLPTAPETPDWLQNLIEQVRQDDRQTITVTIKGKTNGSGKHLLAGQQAAGHVENLLMSLFREKDITVDFEAI